MSTHEGVSTHGGVYSGDVCPGGVYPGDVCPGKCLSPDQRQILPGPEADPPDQRQTLRLRAEDKNT